MNFGHFFTDRPIFATVISIVLVLLGALAYSQLPVAQYPEIAPPSIVVRATYPGADADTVAKTIAAPIEEEINGVEGMIYMSSYSTSDGAMALTITFELGTNLDSAQVLVQNRVAIAEPRLPEEARRLGITTTKSSPDLMMVVHMLSPDDSLDQLYVSNYARSRVRDILVRQEGVGDLRIFGERQFALRIWLDPEKLAGYGMTAADVVEALREQNVQVSGGSIGAPPNTTDSAFQYTVTAQGRFESARQFRYVIVKATPEGRLIQLQDIARIELGARDYTLNSYLNNKPAVALGIFQRPGTNALEAANEIIDTMAELSEQFPPGLDYQIVYNPTEFISQSIDEVYRTIIEAALLVMLVIFIFLQSIRSALIPVIAIPVSLIGTFAVMQLFGFSLNTLTLFGLVLAIGIVVDDAIVVVENTERCIREGDNPRKATHRSMTEVSAALIATSLVLVAVFVPTAFVPGISGQFYTQFALTIAVATVISTLNSLTLSPALAAILLKPPAKPGEGNVLSRFGGKLADAFNRAFDIFADAYARVVRFLVSRALSLVLLTLTFAGLLVATQWLAERIPQGFIPPMDQGYAIVVVKLPDGAALERTDAVIKRASEIARAAPGITNAVGFAGLDGSTFTIASNAGVIFTTFEDFDTRLAQGLTADAIIGDLFGRMQAIQEAFIIAIPPPPIRGIGTGGGFKLQLQDRDLAEIDRVLAAARDLMGTARGNEAVTGVFTTSSASSPQLFLDIERDKARMLNVSIPAIFETLSINLGTSYVNDFNAFGRVNQVRAQADEEFRLDIEDIERLKVRSATGELVPLGTLVDISMVAGPNLVQRYNMYVSVPVQGNTPPSVSTGDALDAMEAMAAEVLPPGLSFEWTELAFQQRQASDIAILILGLAIVFAFLVLAAQYESWVLPIIIVLIVPLAVLSALGGVWLRGMDNNILTQIGFIVLVGLAAKNAILIVEFAKQAEDRGVALVDAVVESCRLRLRPILMTAIAFILGVVPLMIATGPGAEMRQALGTAVFFGMLGVTFLGLFFTPAFYVILRRLTSTKQSATKQVSAEI